MTLTATVRAVSASRARQIRPMPPPPTSRSRWNRRSMTSGSISTRLPRLERHLERPARVPDQEVAIPAAEPDAELPRRRGVDDAAELAGHGLQPVDVVLPVDARLDLADDPVAPALELEDPGAVALDVGLEPRARRRVGAGQRRGGARDLA